MVSSLGEKEATPANPSSSLSEDKISFLIAEPCGCGEAVDEGSPGLEPEPKGNSAVKNIFSGSEPASDLGGVETWGTVPFGEGRGSSALDLGLVPSPALGEGLG